MLKIFIVISLLLGSYQNTDPKSILKEIVTIAQKEHLSQHDYQTVIRLANENTVSLDEYLKSEGILYQVKSELLDAIYEDSYNQYEDEELLKEREKICHWVQGTYPKDSKEYKVADSRLVEIYTLWKKYDKAVQQLESNLKQCTYPSLDHATCIYTLAWMTLQMQDKETARTEMQKAIEEYKIIIQWGKELTNRKDIPHNEILNIEESLKEAKDALKDAKIFISTLN